MTRRVRTAALITIFLSIALAAVGQPSAGKLYGVIFGVVVDEGGRLVSFRVDEVIDPRSGSTAAVDVAVPDSYIAAARKLAESKRYKPTLKDGKPVEFFTWFYFDPSQPDRADISVDP